MLTIPFNAVMEDSCSKPSDKGVFFQGKVTGGAQIDSVPVCESSSCETRVKHVRTKTMHDDEQRFEFWEPDMELIPRVYRLIFGRENYTQ
uniref:Uncharacterized protein n=1 Tax=Romanomermis culicivorax TaxID=13658 RepID=A0A915IKW3_ROMCU